MVGAIPCGCPLGQSLAVAILNARWYGNFRRPALDLNGTLTLLSVFEPPYLGAIKDFRSFQIKLWPYIANEY